MSRRVLAVVIQVSRLQLRSPLLWGLLGLCLLAVVFARAFHQRDRAGQAGPVAREHARQQVSIARLATAGCHAPGSSE
ncbi:MAG: hypothetical protein KDC10_15155 [Calditrichaeota bacterium]|nr:hypothetical protein [Calditrichota bacterium]